MRQGILAGAAMLAALIAAPALAQSMITEFKSSRIPVQKADRSPAFLEADAVEFPLAFAQQDERLLTIEVEGETYTLRAVDVVIDPPLTAAPPPCTVAEAQTLDGDAENNSTAMGLSSGCTPAG